MLDTIAKWNRWGGANLFSGYKRSISDQVCRFTDTPDIIVLVGLRRAGKTTVLFQVMDYLEAQQVPQEAVLHVNFEEPALGTQLNLQLLDKIYETYRSSIYPDGKAYLFFDEIQNVAQWERWVRARNESENIKIFLTGSSAHLMSRELGTLLTGRHLSFPIFPLSFNEYLQFLKIDLPKKCLPIAAPHTVQHALQNYLKWGGLPEVVLSQTDERRELLLKQYFDDLLFKDVAMRYQIRDINLLRNLAIYLLTQTASLISFHRIATKFGISLETARTYGHCLQAAFLIDFLPFYSLKASERNRNPQKVHALDLGLRQIAAFSGSSDLGRNMETLVYQQLKRSQQYDIYYWKGKQEIDFALRKGNTITQLIQVAADDLSDEKIYQRERKALDEATLHFKNAETQLITGNFSSRNDKMLVPLWYFLCKKG